MRRWWPAVVPPWWMLACLASGYVLFEAPRFVASLVSDRDVLQSMKLVGGEIAIIVGAGLFGMWRMAAFSPLFRPKYAKWLESTPWTARGPLPLGPIQFVWQDAFLLSILALASGLLTELPFWFAPLVFLGSYMLVVTISLVLTNQWLHTYLALFGAGLVPLTFQVTWLLSLVIAGLYLVVWLGIRASLTVFPWSASNVLQELNVKLPQCGPSSGCWPHDALHPQPQPWCVPQPHGVLIGMLFGWWIFALAVPIEPPRDRAEFLGPWAVIVPLTVVGVRTVIYKWSYGPPISLWGRIRTRQWIIPGHDAVYLPQAITLGIATAGLVIARFSSQIIWVPVIVAASVVCGLSLPPKRRDWMLLGQNRLRGAWNKTTEARRI